MEKTVIKVDIPFVCNFRTPLRRCTIKSIQCKDPNKFPALCPHRGGVVFETPFNKVSKDAENVQVD